MRGDLRPEGEEGRRLEGCEFGVVTLCECVCDGGVLERMLPKAALSALVWSDLEALARMLGEEANEAFGEAVCLRFVACSVC